MGHVFQAEPRDTVGTGSVRALRHDGKVPAVIYGDKKDPQHISLSARDLESAYTSLAFFSRVYTLNLGKTTEQVIAKEVQLHPVTDLPLHVDFQRVNKDSKIHVSVPVHFINDDKAPGIKRGGTLNIVVHTLDIICSPHAIPQELTVDLTGLEAGKSITLSVLSLPEGAKAAYPDRDNVLATIVAASSDADKADAA